MIRQLFHRLFAHRHFWREVSFSEMSEIYISMMFRSLSVSLTSIFIPLYMLKLDYSFLEIITLFFWYFVFRALIFDYIAGYMTAKLGPKHTILYSYGLLTLSTLLFLTLGHVTWPVWLLAALWGGSTSLFTIPFSVDFSKVKNKAHSGKELGYVNVIEKFGGIAGPIIGGVIATFFGGQYIFIVSIFLLVLGGMTLLRTSEPTQTGQDFSLRYLPYRRMKRDLVAMSAYGIELTMGAWVWALYLAIFVLASATAYAQMGALASLSVVMAMVTAYGIGKLIDKRKGRILLRSGAILNAGLHFIRPFVTVFPMALLVNVVNEGVSIAYRMPFIKGFYDAADEHPGQRIAYCTAMELIASFTKVVVWGFLVILAQFLAPYPITVIGFIIAGLASLAIMAERFKALDAK